MVLERCKKLKHLFSRNVSIKTLASQTCWINMNILNLAKENVQEVSCNHLCLLVETLLYFAMLIKRSCLHLKCSAFLEL